MNLIPSFQTGLKLGPGAKVVTMGSCFARNIEEYFQAEGFDVPVMDYSAPLARRLTVLKPQVIVGYRLEYRIRCKRGDQAAALDAVDRAIANSKDVAKKDFLGDDGKAEHDRANVSTEVS